MSGYQFAPGGGSGERRRPAKKSGDEQQLPSSDLHAMETVQDQSAPPLPPPPAPHGVNSAETVRQMDAPGSFDALPPWRQGALEGLEETAPWQGTVSSTHVPRAPSALPQVSQEELDWAAASKREKQMKFVALIAAGAIFAMAALGIVAWKIVKRLTTPWGPSPIAESLAPDRETDITLAIYTFQLIQLTETIVQPGFHRTGSLPPSMTAMARAGVIEERWAYDGWGRLMEYHPDERYMLSLGADGVRDTADDISKTFFQTPMLPEVYYDGLSTYEANAMQIKFLQLVETGQIGLDLSGVGFMLEEMPDESEMTPEEYEEFRESYMWMQEQGYTEE